MTSISGIRTYKNKNESIGQLDISFKRWFNHVCSSHTSFIFRMVHPDRNFQRRVLEDLKYPFLHRLLLPWFHNRLDTMSSEEVSNHSHEFDWRKPLSCAGARCGTPGKIPNFITSYSESVVFPTLDIQRSGRKDKGSEPQMVGVVCNESVLTIMKVLGGRVFLSFEL